MPKLRTASLSLVIASALMLGVGCTTGDTGAEAATLETSQALNKGGAAKRVLLLSIDGFHQFDLEKFVASHPSSTLAGLVGRGTQYTETTSSRPSDSFPGTLAMTTGGSPATTGIFYDVSWDDNLSPAGDTTCATRGAVAAYDGQANFDDTLVTTSINPALLPRDPAHGCQPVYPHSYLKVNTIFEVIKAAGLRTAVTDKHPTYELLNGPSGQGVDDLFTPENDANGAKKNIAKMEAYDETKVQAVLNQLGGYDHTGTSHVGVPGIMMMNFQSANIGEKVGGYADAAGNPTADLAGAFAYVDDAIGRMLAKLSSEGLTSSTLVIVTAKHGDSPVDLASRRAIDPALVDAVVNSVQPGLLALNTPDTIELLWLKDHSRAGDVAAALQAHAADLGIETIYSGTQIETAFDHALDSSPARRPDVIIQPVPGVIYTTSGVSAKKVEHGGFSAENTHVPLIVAGPRVARGTVTTPVDLRQVAPTILKALGLKPKDLQAVRAEKVHRLPTSDDDACDDNDD